jgi:NitT/TauT family transport system permease protein
VTTWRQRTGSIVLTAIVWEMAARAIDSPVLPPCSAVLAALVSLVEEGQVFGNLAASLSTLAAGYTFAVVAGVTVGGVMGLSRRAARVLDPYLNAGLASPMLIYVPVLLTIGGTSRGTQVATVFLYSVFAIASYTLAGVRGVNPCIEEMARSFGATRIQVFRRVTWPAARPLMLTGLRVGVALGIKGMVNGEILVASTGLGALIRLHGGRFEPDRVLALVLVIVSVALAATGTIRAFERRASRGVSLA